MFKKSTQIFSFLALSIMNFLIITDLVFFVIKPSENVIIGPEFYLLIANYTLIPFLIVLGLVIIPMLINVKNLVFEKQLKIALFIINIFLLLYIFLRIMASIGSVQ